MPKPPIDQKVADLAPVDAVLTAYDHQHLITYLRLLDAESQGADWSEVSKIILGIDSIQEPERARNAWKSHLARAHWMTETGYKDLLKDAG